MSRKRLISVHPGEILLEEFLVPFGISQSRLAVDITVPPRRINEIVLGKRGISPDTALRLSRYFGLSEQFWINLQSRFDLETERTNSRADSRKKFGYCDVKGQNRTLNREL